MHHNNNRDYSPHALRLVVQLSLLLTACNSAVSTTVSPRQVELPRDAMSLISIRGDDEACITMCQALGAPSDGARTILAVIFSTHESTFPGRVGEYDGHLFVQYRDATLAAAACNWQPGSIQRSLLVGFSHGSPPPMNESSLQLAQVPLPMGIYISRKSNDAMLQAYSVNASDLRIEIAGTSASAVELGYETIGGFYSPIMPPYRVRSIIVENWKSVNFGGGWLLWFNSLLGMKPV